MVRAPGAASRSCDRCRRSASLAGETCRAVARIVQYHLTFAPRCLFGNLGRNNVRDGSERERQRRLDRITREN